MTREEAITVLNMVEAHGSLVIQAKEIAIEALKQTQWIPVAERLPEDSGRYLVSVLDGIDSRTTVAPYHPQSRTWTLTGRMAYWRVLAWQPLPQPYKVESEG